MLELDEPFRMASAADAVALADLVNFAGEGLPLHIWTGMAENGQDPWQIGRARQAAMAEQGKIVVADLGEGAVASLTGYVIGPEPEPISDDVPDLFGPLIELENLALGSWYVNVLACYPAQRGHGLGARLLDIADRIGAAEGQAEMSVIVAGHNTGARRLYERKGYRERARRPCHPGDWDTVTDSWVLLTKRL